jgi:hypothetical protein
MTKSWLTRLGVNIHTSCSLKISKYRKSHITEMSGELNMYTTITFYLLLVKKNQKIRFYIFDVALDEC